MTIGTTKPTARERNPLTASCPRRFQLVREEDETGISGTGVVAEDVEFSNGFCAMSWLTSQHSVAVYPNARALEAIHGHNGRARLRWMDVPDDGTATALEAAASLEYDDFRYEIMRAEFERMVGRPFRFVERAARAHGMAPAGL